MNPPRDQNTARRRTVGAVLGVVLLSFVGCVHQDEPVACSPTDGANPLPPPGEVKDAQAEIARSKRVLENSSPETRRFIAGVQAALRAGKLSTNHVVVKREGNIYDIYGTFVRAAPLR